MEEDVAKEISLKVEVLMEMYQAMEIQCTYLQDKTLFENQQNLFKKKQNETKEQISEKFKELRKALRAAEMQVLDNLHHTYSQFEDKFTIAALQNNKLIKEVETWVDKAKGSLNEYTNKITENPSYIDFNMLESAKENNRDDILNQGESILEKIEKEKDFPSLNGLEASYN